MVSMMRAHRIRLVALATVAAAIAIAAFAATSGTRHATTDCTLEPGAHLALTQSYRFVLRIGPVEGMLMPYQVRANHVKHGEVMLGGRMFVPTHGPLHHLEVHICARTTGGVIANAHPTIVLVDETNHRTPTKIPVAVMEGIDVGRADLHYGNTVAMPHHHRYTIRVTTKHERAIFHLVAP